MRIYKTTFINKGGVIPWADPVTNESRVTKEQVLERADNPEALDHDGITNICVISSPDCWHITEAGGYTPENGMFCLVY